MPDSAPTLVVFGFDPDGSPRAGRFTEPNGEIAVKAAVLLGYEAIRVSDAEILEALPDGNVFAHGDGFIRRINRFVFDTLSIVEFAAESDDPSCKKGGM
jgi:hypothetical protein